MVEGYGRKRKIAEVRRGLGKRALSLEELSGVGGARLSKVLAALGPVNQLKRGRGQLGEHSAYEEQRNYVADVFGCDGAWMWCKLPPM